MSLKIIPFYAGLLGLFYVYLTVRVVKARGKFQVALGDGGHKELERAVAVHQNFAEYVPLTLLLLAFLEMNLVPAFLLHAFGILLLLGRIAHAVGVSQINENYTGRKYGMALTLTVLLMGSAGALYVTAAWFVLG